MASSPRTTFGTRTSLESIPEDGEVSLFRRDSGIELYPRADTRRYGLYLQDGPTQAIFPRQSWSGSPTVTSWLQKSRVPVKTKTCLSVPSLSLESRIPTRPRATTIPSISKNGKLSEPSKITSRPSIPPRRSSLSPPRLNRRVALTTLPQPTKANESPSKPYSIDSHPTSTTRAGHTTQESETSTIPIDRQNPTCLSTRLPAPKISYANTKKKLSWPAKPASSPQPSVCNTTSLTSISPPELPRRDPTRLTSTINHLFETLDVYTDILSYLSHQPSPFAAQNPWTNPNLLTNLQHSLRLYTATTQIFPDELKTINLDRIAFQTAMKWSKHLNGRNLINLGIWCYERCHRLGIESVPWEVLERIVMRTIEQCAEMEKMSSRGCRTATTETGQVAHGEFEGSWELLLAHVEFTDDVILTARARGLEGKTAGLERAVFGRELDRVFEDALGEDEYDLEEFVGDMVERCESGR